MSEYVKRAVAKKVLLGDKAQFDTQAGEDGPPLPSMPKIIPTPRPPLVHPPKEGKVVFESGATRCDIGRAEYYLIAPIALRRIAIVAGTVIVSPRLPVEHVNLAVNCVGMFLHVGYENEDCSQVHTDNLALAAIHVMYAIDPTFQPMEPHLTCHTRPAFHLLPGKGIAAAADAWGEGKVKYSSYNWEKGMPADVILNHFYKHAFDYYARVGEEDHLAHMLWNLITAIHSLHAWPKLNKGKFRVKGNPPKE